jgi:hypothetical protein
MGTGIAVVATVAVVVFVLGSRKSPGPDELYTHLIPAWQIFRSQELRKTDSPAAKAMLRAAQAWPELSASLRELDRGYPDGVTAILAHVNQTARKVGVPYWLDAKPVKGWPVLLSHHVEQIHHWTAAGKSVEVIHLRRVDQINVELGLIGQASYNGPLVFLDRIEDEWVDELSRVEDPSAATVDREARKLMLSRIRGHTEVDPSPLLADLIARHKLFEAMQNRMKVVVPRPTGLFWSERWFDHMESLTKFGNGRGPMVFDSDLRLVREANRPMAKPEYRRIIAALVALRAENVEVHEARHAVETDGPPMPSILQSWPNAGFADQINKELRAYLGELHDSPHEPCLSLAALIRAAYSPKSRPTPHAFAGQIIARGLARDERTVQRPSRQAAPADEAADPLAKAFPEIEPVAFMQAVCAADTDSLRRRSAGLWQDLYHEPMPELRRQE